MKWRNILKSIFVAVRLRKDSRVDEDYGVSRLFIEKQREIDALSAGTRYLF